MALDFAIMVQHGFDRNYSGNKLDLDVGPWEVASVQVVNTLGTWSASVLTIYRSCDGVNFTALETPTSFSAEGISDAIDVSGIYQLRIQCDTPEGSAATASIIACCKARK